MNMCRACLCTDKDLLQVDEQFISSYNLLTNLNVKPFDSMPKRFCPSCIESVAFFITFRGKCITSESILQEQNVNIKHDEVTVEIDIKHELDGDLAENCQYELVVCSVKEEVKKESSADTETKPLAKEEINPLEIQKVVNSTKDRSKKQLKTAHEYICGLCKESFVDLENLNKHIDVHQSDDQCGICSKKFENWPKLLAHGAVHSARKLCHLCPRRFYSLVKMEQHYLHAHFKDKMTEMFCEQCKKTFTCQEKFSKHQETHNIECHICSEIIVNRQALKMHLRTHDAEKLYACDQCEYTALHADVLAHHKKRRHKKFTCKICDRKFAERATFKKHICKDKSKLCPICGQRIYMSFNRHMKSHQNVKNFKCEKCPASFKSPMSLKVHMDRHDKNPAYACDYCGRKFYYKQVLSKHRRVHTGEKPYECNVCGKRFTGSSNRKIHMEVHGIMLINKKNKDPVQPPVGD